jgi:hypothetical protein
MEEKEILQEIVKRKKDIELLRKKICPTCRQVIHYG